MSVNYYRLIKLIYLLNSSTYLLIGIGIGVVIAIAIVIFDPDTDPDADVRRGILIIFQTILFNASFPLKVIPRSTE